MAGGYRARATGPAGVVESFRSLQRQIDAIRSTGNLKEPQDPVTPPPDDSGTGTGTSTGASQIWPVVVKGLKFDGVTDCAPIIQRALEAVEDGKTPGHLIVTGPAGSIGYLNSTITLSLSGCQLQFDPTVKWMGGPDLRIRQWGTIPETPTTNAEKPALTQDAPAGSVDLHVSQIPADWTAGIYVGLRGKRDPSGSVPNSEIFRTYVAAIDRSNPDDLVITLASPLPKDFVVINDTEWTNKASQVTKITQTPLQGTPLTGNTVLDVEDSSIFTAGAIVQIQDDQHTIDGDDSIRVGNFAHKEVARVAEIIDATHVKLAAGLEHSYDLEKNARATLLNALQDTQIIGLTLGWQSQQNLGQHAIETRYAYNCHVIDCHIEGSGDGGMSWSGHAGRITDSLLCTIQRCTAANPSLVDAGHGYGFTFYGSTRCKIVDSAVTGARHSFLYFNGSASCDVVNCTSDDDRTSGIDWHGAEESNNKAIGCTIRGGTRRTGDSEGNRAAIKFGNPSQTNGARSNQVIDCVVENYHGAAVAGLPRSAGNQVQGLIVRRATVGIRLTPIPDAGSTAVHDGFTVRNSAFYDVLAPLEVDGGPNSTLKQLLLDDVEFKRCGPLQLIGAPGARLRGVSIVDPTGDGWQIKAWNSPGVAITGSDLSGAPKGIALAGCPNARVTGNRLHDLDGPVWHDGGGNTGALLRSNEIFPDGSFTHTGTPSAGITQQTLTDAGTEDIGDPITGTTWVDPEGAVGGDGTTPPGSGGGTGGGDDGGDDGEGTTPPPSSGGGDGNGFPLVNRSKLKWNSGFFHGGGDAGDATGSAATDLRSRPMDVYETFTGRTDWDQMGYIDPSWAAWSQIGILVISIPPQPAPDHNPPNDADTARGLNNAWWRNYGLRLKNAGIKLKNTVIRLGWEANGDWYAWAWGGSRNDPSSYVAAYKNVVAAMRETAPGLWFSANMNKNNKRPDGTDWRGVMRQLKGYADIVGLDCYDMYNASRNAAEWSANMLGQNPGLTSVADFCRDEGFLMSLEEWAPVVAGGADGTGGGDNPYYINAMFGWLSSNYDVIAYEVFYDHVGTSNYNHKMNVSSDPAGWKPNAWTAYKNHWGLAA